MGTEALMHEIAPGVVHWSVPHSRIGQDVDSFLLAERGVLLNPMLPPEGLEPLRTGPVAPTDVVLTNRHHVRDTSAFVEAFGCAVHVPRRGWRRCAPRARTPAGTRPATSCPHPVVGNGEGVLRDLVAAQP